MGINQDVIPLLKDNTYLVSASSDRTEIDVDFLIRASGKADISLHRPCPFFASTNPEIGRTYFFGAENTRLHLLAHGYPVNFFSESNAGMRDDAADIIMTMILLATAELANGKYKGQKGIMRHAFDDLVRDKDHAICEVFEKLRRKSVSY